MALSDLWPNLYGLARPFLFEMDPEAAHAFTIALMRRGLVPRFKCDVYPSLQTKVCGIPFSNPVGLAAGFDKNAEVISDAIDLGFGFVELGTITPKPQPGNPKPRIFRVVSAEAVINRYGFNSDGAAVCLRRIAAFRDAGMKKKAGIIGINIGKNKDSVDAVADYVKGIATFKSYADYLVVNISSPNTPGLRDLQAGEALTNLLKHVVAARDAGGKPKPVFVKIAPDLTEPQQHEIAEIVVSSGIDGLIIGNTTVTRPNSIPQNLAKEEGGLSGKPLFALSTQVLASIYRLTGGKIPLIGCGGVSSGADAYAKIRAGASLVQIYTALIYKGPFLVSHINRELAALLERDGLKSVSEAVGVDVK